MKIVVSKLVGQNKDYSPIMVRLTDRADITALTIRIIRYFFAVGPQEYRWRSDRKKSKIYIEDSYNENPTTENQLPAIAINIGGIQYKDMGIGDGLSYDDMDTTKIKALEGDTSVTIQIYGRNKLETYRLSDFIGRNLFLFAKEITDYSPDITDVVGINVSPVSPAQGVFDTSKIFTASVSFAILFKLAFKKVSIAPLFTKALFSGLVTDEDHDKEIQVQDQIEVTCDFQPVLDVENED